MPLTLGFSLGLSSFFDSVVGFFDFLRSSSDVHPDRPVIIYLINALIANMFATLAVM